MHKKSNQISIFGQDELCCIKSLSQEVQITIVLTYPKGMFTCYIKVIIIHYRIYTKHVIWMKYLFLTVNIACLVLGFSCYKEDVRPKMNSRHNTLVIFILCILSAVMESDSCSIFKYFNLPIIQSVNISIYLYFNLSLFQSVNISIF